MTELTKRQAQIVAASADIRDKEPTIEDGNIGFGVKALSAASLPYNNPKPEQLIDGAWVRRNGQFSLFVQGSPGIGIPYGSYPRVISIYLASQAIITGDRCVSLGGSFSGFCKRVGIDRSRGKRGGGKYLMDQLDRFLNARIGFVKEEHNFKASELMNFATQSVLMWDDSFENDAQGNLFDATVTLSEGFFDAITTSPIPLDMRAVSILKQKALSLDIYQWLAYRYYSLGNRTSHPSWEQLSHQFGSQFSRLVDFRKAFKKALVPVKAAYPNARFELDKTGMLLLPSPTPVRPILVRGADLKKIE